jgi:hypothetical protein
LQQIEVSDTGEIKAIDVRNKKNVATQQRSDHERVIGLSSIGRETTARRGECAAARRRGVYGMAVDSRSARL